MTYNDAILYLMNKLASGPLLYRALSADKRDASLLIKSEEVRNTLYSTVFLACWHSSGNAHEGAPGAASEGRRGGKRSRPRLLYRKRRYLTGPAKNEFD